MGAHSLFDGSCSSPLHQCLWFAGKGVWWFMLCWGGHEVCMRPNYLNGTWFKALLIVSNYCFECDTHCWATFSFVGAKFSSKQYGWLELDGVSNKCEDMISIGFVRTEEGDMLCISLEILSTFRPNCVCTTCGCFTCGPGNWAGSLWSGVGLHLCLSSGMWPLMFRVGRAYVRADSPAYCCLTPRCVC